MSRLRSLLGSPLRLVNTPLRWVTHAKTRRMAVLRGVLLMASAVVLVWGLVSLSRAGTVFWVFTAATQWSARQLGMDYYTALIFGVAATAALITLLPNITAFLLFGREGRIVASGILGATVIATGLIYTLGDDVYFDRRTGEPLRYIAHTPSGVRYSFTPGFDPEFGVPFVPFTREMALRGTPAPEADASADSLASTQVMMPQGEASFSVQQGVVGWRSTDVIVAVQDLRVIRASMEWELRLGLCNKGPNALSRMDLSAWYTIEERFQTVRWSLTVDETASGACQELYAVVENPGFDLGVSLGTLYISVDGETAAASIEFSWEAPGDTTGRPVAAAKGTTAETADRIVNDPLSRRRPIDDVLSDIGDWFLSGLGSSMPGKDVIVKAEHYSVAEPGLWGWVGITRRSRLRRL